MKNTTERLERFMFIVDTPMRLFVKFVFNASTWRRAGNICHTVLLWSSPYTWFVQARAHMAARRQREAEALAAAIEASKPITLDASEFEFRHRGGMIYAILDGTIPDGSLDEEASEELDLQLVWSQHRDHEHKDLALRAIAELKEGWLWRRCAQAMTPKSNFYRDKALGVANGRVQKVDIILSVGGESAAQAVEQFATRTAGDPISVDAWHALSRANYDRARVAGGFHVCLGHVRQSLFSIGGFTVSAKTPVYFNGPQSEGERNRQTHFWQLGNRARTRAAEEQARQAAAA